MGILERLELDYDLELIEDFLSHYGVMCLSMEPLIISLNNASNYTENINELFRIFHNIKSSSGFLKLDPIIKLASLTEEVLEETRSLQGPATDEFIDWLLLISDQFEQYRLDVEEDKEHFSLLNPLVVKIPINLQKE